MRLLRARCLGLVGVPDGAWDFAPEGSADADVVLLHGPPASGQTRLLEVIAAARERLAPTGLELDDARWIERGYRTAKIELTFWFDEEERELTRFGDPVVETEVVFGREHEIDLDLEQLLGTYGHERGTPKLEYFPARRAIERNAPVALDVFTQEKLRSGKDPRKYSFIPRYLKQLADRGEHARFAALLGAFTDTCRFEPDPGPAGFTFVSRRGERCSLFELSASETDAVIFAATTALIGLDRSLVLVDRPDLHLRDDPARLLAALRGLGDGAQIIAASASPALLAALPASHVVEMAPR